MKHPKDISISDFTYKLPDEKIALFPLEQRHDSKLLVYKEGSISESNFKNLHEFLPESSLLFFNNTRVINARLLFKKETGGSIEIFCLEPADGKTFMESLNTKGSVIWNCFVGGVTKWKSGILTTTINGITLHAELTERVSDMYRIAFRWQPEAVVFSEVIRTIGNIPLPPYIKRAAAQSDAERYQTLFAEQEGSVAAPTASLHFTETVMQNLQLVNIAHQYITLHVGAGTFKPVKAASMKDHEMHAEWFEVSFNTVEKLIEHKGKIIVAGTTSLRTIETLYWLGVKLFIQPEHSTIPSLAQWEVYDDLPQNIDAVTAMTALRNWMQSKKLENIYSQTALIIAPGYHYRLADVLITNFHQPESTLLLLIAAAVGDDWKKIYDYALHHQFRFLSYGDGSVLYIRQRQ